MISEFDEKAQKSLVESGVGEVVEGVGWQGPQTPNLLCASATQLLRQGGVERKGILLRQMLLETPGRRLLTVA